MSPWATKAMPNMICLLFKILYLPSNAIARGRRNLGRKLNLNMIYLRALTMVLMLCLIMPS